MKYYLPLMFFLFTCTITIGQVNIRGTVHSLQDNHPIAGTLIRVKGTSVIASTDSLGNFSIVTSSFKSVLEISHLGYVPTEIPLVPPFSKPISILLDLKVNELKEVVISTGYQTLPKERAAGSFNFISNKQLNEQLGSGILSRLEAVANGVIADRTTSGGNGRLMVRGLSSIQGPKDPLIVVDNFPYEGDINNVNPNDVESVTILKDAAAASIWGTRAGNGVVVITTKKGRLNQPITVDFNTSITVGDKPNLFYIPQISSSDFIDVETMLYNNGYYNSQINSSSKPALSPVVELLIKRKTATAAETEQIDQQIGVLKNTDVRNDFNKYLYRKSLNEQYALNIKGGSNVMAWSLSSGYDRNRGNLSEGYERLNLRFQNTVKLFNGMELSSGVYFTQATSTSGRPGYGDITSKNSALFPYAQFADDNGNPLPLIKDYRQSYIQTAGNGKLLNWQYYPLEDYKHLSNTSKINDILANLGLNYKLLPGLNADVKYQYERQQTDGRNLRDADSYFARNLVNSYTQISMAGDVIYKVPPGGVLDLSEKILQSNNIRGQLNFDKEWSKHSITALAGSEIRELHIIGNSNRIYGYNDDLLTFGNVDYTTQYPNFITGSKSFIPGGAGLSDGTTRFVSVFGNAAYTYDGRYTFSLSGRRDASNLFGVNTNDKWNLLWSSGLSWNISKENFYKSTLLPYLKLRATYGLNGNVDPSKSAVTTIQYVTLSPNTLTPYSRFSKYANPELKWETNAIVNIGLDFATSSNRISGSIEYYHKKGTDLFGTSPLDYTGGVGTSVIKNVASLEGNGWDLELNSRNIDAQFKWLTNFNFSINHDKVTQYYLASRQGSFFLNGTNNISGIEGKPIYSVFAYKWAGLDPQTGQPRGYLNGEVSESYALITSTGTQIEDLQYFGSAIPTIFGSLGNAFSYKKVSLSVRLLCKFGYYFRRNSINYATLYSGWVGNSDIANRWQQPGDELNTDVPALVYPYPSAMQALYTFSAPLVERGDHIRLQYINLSYDLNKAQWKPLPFKSIQCYLNVSNVGIIWRANKKGLDPDYTGSTSTPLPITWAIGLKGNF